MHIVRREQPEPDVMMRVVVPGEEVAAEAAPVFERTETAREAGPVLEGLELRLGEWVVVRDVRPRVALGDAEVGEQQRDGLRRDRRAAVRMHGELARRGLGGTEARGVRASYRLVPLQRVHRGAEGRLSPGADDGREF